ncbi:MAG: hypothetical protein ACLS37_12500 [Alistipes sp.]
MTCDGITAWDLGRMQRHHKREADRKPLRWSTPVTGGARPDAQRDTQAFRRIAARYQLIGVNCHLGRAAGCGIGAVPLAPALLPPPALLDRAPANAPTISTRVSVTLRLHPAPSGDDRLMPRAGAAGGGLSEHRPAASRWCAFMGDTALLSPASRSCGRRFRQRSDEGLRRRK